MVDCVETKGSVKIGMGGVGMGRGGPCRSRVWRNTGLLHRGQFLEVFEAKEGMVNQFVLNVAWKFEPFASGSVLGVFQV